MATHLIALSPVHRQVLAALAADPRRWVARGPSRRHPDTLDARCGMPEAAVSKALAALVTAGMVRRHGRYEAYRLTAAGAGVLHE